MYQALGRFLVTRRRIGPAGNGCDDAVGEAEQGIKFGHLFLGCRGFANAQGVAAPGGQDNGADLMGLESVAHSGPGGMAAAIEQGFFDGDEEVKGEHAQKDVAFDPALVLIVDRALGERRFHVAEGSSARVKSA